MDGEYKGVHSPIARTFRSSWAPLDAGGALSFRTSLVVLLFAMVSLGRNFVLW